MAEEKTQTEKFIRPPIVVVMGHIDHGKTSLLDNIRKSHVAERESGGITQHVGAYEIEYKGKKITFIDTPGHEAFSAMRSRSAKVADIAILVVAADEGIKPQTKEAIKHIKEAGIEMIVAINKMDKPEANPERVKRDLANEEVFVESIGGQTPSVNVSATTGSGVSDLLDLILLVAEVKELEADPRKLAEGVMIESFLDSQRGATATLLVKDGTLKVGDIIGTASSFGKIKTLLDFQKEMQKEAGPSSPALVFGLEGVPLVGEEFKVFDCPESAKDCLRKAEQNFLQGLTAEEGIKSLNLVIKADVLGSVEALVGVLRQLPQENIKLNLLKIEVGDVNENDVKLARESNARVFAFRVKPNSAAKMLLDRDKMDIVSCDIIYNLVEKVRILMEKSLENEIERVEIGEMETLAVFLTERNRQIVGGRVFTGEMRRSASLEVWRQEQQVGNGKIINLQKNKKDAEKVEKGNECGILFEGNTKVEVGDILKAFVEQKKKIVL